MGVPMIDKEHMEESVKTQVEVIQKKHGIEEFNGSIRFFGTKLPVKLDGNFSIEEMRCLLEIAEHLNSQE